MPWSYENEHGTDTQGVFATQEDAIIAVEKDPEYALDLKHRGLSFLRQHSCGTGQVIQDSIPQHWNPAFPVPVNGRQQFKRLQKQFGTSDYEPKHEMKERLDHYAKKAAHDGSHRR